MKLKNLLSDFVYQIDVIRNRMVRLGYRRKLIKDGLLLGNNTYIDEGVKIYYPQNVKIGSNVHINRNVHFYANHGKITIDDNTTISAECNFVATGYDLNSFTQGSREHLQDKEIYIGPDNWICMGATVLPGVHITGHHVVVAAGAVVTSNVSENNVILAGVPARIIRYI